MLEVVGRAVTLVRAQATNDDHFWEEFRIDWRMILEGDIFLHVGDSGLKKQLRVTIA